MYIDFTIYVPNTIGMPYVGFYIYDKRDPATRKQLGGDPSMPLKQFHEIVTGTYQYNDFLDACSRANIDLRKFI